MRKRLEEGKTRSSFRTQNLLLTVDVKNIIKLQISNKQRVTSQIKIDKIKHRADENLPKDKQAIDASKQTQQASDLYFQLNKICLLYTSDAADE